MNNNTLNTDEMKIWWMWKSSFENIFGKIAKDTAKQTGLSENDFGILDRLINHGQGELRQQKLVDLMGWTKSRLSHYLMRMERRGLIQRKSLDHGNGINVVITSFGKKELDNLRPVLAKEIRKHFLDKLTKQDIDSITKLAKKTEDDLHDK
ncbi:MarR family transcriptional regulator [Oenococcus sp. UCMA 14587]|nr:MarR family transcriptional regulator [Oenococcus sp. UCMA 14587]